MLRRMLAVVALPLLLGACEGDGGSQGAPTAAGSSVEVRVSAGAEAVCADLLAYREQIAQIIGGQPGSDMVEPIQNVSASTVDALTGHAAGLDGDLADDADGVIGTVDAIVEWRPDDSASLDDVITDAARTIDAFQRGHC